MSSKRRCRPSDSTAESVPRGDSRVTKRSPSTLLRNEVLTLFNCSRFSTVRSCAYSVCCHGSYFEVEQAKGVCEGQATAASSSISCARRNFYCLRKRATPNTVTQARDELMGYKVSVASFSKFHHLCIDQGYGRFQIWYCCIEMD